MWKALIPTLLGAVTPLAARAADALNVSKGATLAGPGLAPTATTWSLSSPTERPRSARTNMPWRMPAAPTAS